MMAFDFFYFIQICRIVLEKGGAQAKDFTHQIVLRQMKVHTGTQYLQKFKNLLFPENKPVWKPNRCLVLDER